MWFIKFNVLQIIKKFNVQDKLKILIWKAYLQRLNSPNPRSKKLGLFDVIYYNFITDELQLTIDGLSLSKYRNNYLEAGTIV